MFTKNGIIVAALFLAILSVIGNAQDSDDEKEIFSTLRHTHRINAHGDEFMSMDMSPDKKRLAIGTEKGDVIIWNLEVGKLEKQFHEGKPIHEIVFTSDDSVVIAGGNHTGVHNCLFGKVNIASGKFEEWSSAGNDSLMYMSFDDRSHVLVVGTVAGYISAWDSLTGKQKALWNTGKTTLGMAVAESTVYVSQSDIDISKGLDEDQEVKGEIVTYSTADVRSAPKTFVTRKLGYATRLRFSPDNKLLAANLFRADKAVIGFFDRGTANEIGSIEGTLNAKWVSNDRLLISDDEEPLKFCTISADGKITADEINKGGGFHGSGNPVDVSGQSVSVDEKFVWQSYKKIGALAEFDIAKKELKLLIVLPPFPYAMDVRELNEKMGYMVTGGDDKFVCLWDLSDLSLVREIQTDTIPQGVALLMDLKRMVYSNSSKEPHTEVYVVNISTGTRKKILTLETPFVAVKAAGNNFVYEGRDKKKVAEETEKKDQPSGDQKDKFETHRLILASADNGSTIHEFDFPEGIDEYANSANVQWLAVIDKKGFVWRVNMAKLTQERLNTEKIDSPTKIAIANDGRFIFITDFYAHLRRWDNEKQKSEVILDGFRGQASSLRLSTDEKFAIIGGNHFDIGVYEIGTKRTGFYTRVDASDFYVPQAWMKGNRLIYITDGGVMFDGILSK